MSALGRFWLIFFFIICDIFLHHFIPTNFLLAIRHCELYLECWVLLYTAILELCSAVLLNYSETVWAFWVLLLRLVRWDQSSYQLMAPSSPIWRLGFSWVIHHEYCVFPSGWWEQVLFLTCVNTRHCCLSSIWMVFSPTVAVRFFYLHALIITQLLSQGALHANLGNSVLPSTVLRLLAALVLLDSLTYLNCGVHQAPACSAHGVTAWKRMATSLRSRRAHIIRFPFHSIHYLSPYV